MSTHEATPKIDPGRSSEARRTQIGKHSDLARAFGIGVVMSAVVAVLLLAFAWPAVHTSPHNLPIAIAGQPATVQNVSAALSQAQPGAFEVTPVADEESARTAILNRDVMGALVIDQKGVTVLTAPGASSAVATLLTELGRTVGAQLLSAQGVTVPNVATQTVVVPGGSGDPLGSGFPSLVLPLVIASLSTGVVTAFVVKSTGGRLLSLLVSAVLAGAWISLIAGTWLGIVVGSWTVAGVGALCVLSVSAALVGAYTLLGRIGIAVVAPVILLLGNPLSAAASAPQLLPAGWSALGQVLPPGAAVQALRSVAFFSFAGAGGPIMILSLWAGIGLVLVLFGISRTPTKPVVTD